MELRSLTELDIYNWTFLFFALVLAGLHLYLGLFVPSVAQDRATQFVVLGLAFLFGPLVYFTPYWQPLLYILGLVFAMYLGSVWVLGGMEYLLFGITAGIMATGFTILGLYLFIREKSWSKKAS